MSLLLNCLLLIDLKATLIPVLNFFELFIRQETIRLMICSKCNKFHHNDFLEINLTIVQKHDSILKTYQKVTASTLESKT